MSDIDDRIAKFRQLRTDRAGVNLAYGSATGLTGKFGGVNLDNATLRRGVLSDMTQNLDGMRQYDVKLADIAAEMKKAAVAKKFDVLSELIKQYMTVAGNVMTTGQQEAGQSARAGAQLAFTEPMKMLTERLSAATSLSSAIANPGPSVTAKISEFRDMAKIPKGGSGEDAIETLATNTDFWAKVTADMQALPTDTERAAYAAQVSTSVLGQGPDFIFSAMNSPKMRGIIKAQQGSDGLAEIGAAAELISGVDKYRTFVQNDAFAAATEFKGMSQEARRAAFGGGSAGPLDTLNNMFEQFANLILLDSSGDTTKLVAAIDDVGKRQMATEIAADSGSLTPAAPAAAPGLAEGAETSAGTTTEISATDPNAEIGEKGDKVWEMQMKLVQELQDDNPQTYPEMQREAKAQIMQTDAFKNFMSEAKVSDPNLAFRAFMRDYSKKMRQTRQQDRVNLAAYRKKQAIGASLAPPEVPTSPAATAVAPAASSVTERESSTQSLTPPADRAKLKQKLGLEPLL